MSISDSSGIWTRRTLSSAERVEAAVGPGAVAVGGAVGPGAVAVGPVGPGAVAVGPVGSGAGTSTEVNKLCLHVGHVLLMRNQCVKLSELNMCPQ